MIRRHRTAMSALALAGLISVAAACGSDDPGSSDADVDVTADADATVPATTPEEGTGGTPAEIPDGPTITIGAQDFGESAILSEIYGQALASAGYPVSQQALGGYRDLVFTAFESGDINFTAEYAASALEFLNGFAGEATPDVDETVGLLDLQLEPLGLVAFAPSAAIDSNSFVVTAETADELGLASVSDLTDDLTLGGPPDCPENPFCIPGLESVYGIDLSANFVPLDGGGPLTVTALEEGEIDVAILFSTSGVIADKGWVVLDDDKGLINADNVVPVGTQELLDVYGPDLAAVIDAVSAALTTGELTELNRRVDIDLEDADVVAKDWLAAEGLV